MPKFQDLREVISHAKEIGELAIVEGADTKYEIGAVNEITSRNQGLAVLFKKIKGYPLNFRVLTNLLSNIKMVNLTFGFPLENSIRDTTELLTRKIVEWEKDLHNLAPKWVESGPIMENVVKDEDIDLTIFPTPVWHDLDVGLLQTVY